MSCYKNAAHILNTMKIYSLILFAFIINSCIGADESSFSYIPVNDINPSERKIVDFESDTIYLSENIYDPGYFDVSEDYLYIIDFETLELYKSSVKSTPSYTKISGRKGRGPGEFERVSGVDVNKERILIGDENLNRINVYNLDGGYLRSIDVGRQGVYRFLELQNGNLVLHSPLVGQNAIKVIDESQQPVFDLLEKSEELSPLVYTGSITSDFENNIYFAGFSEPVLLGFDSKGNKLFSVDVVNSFNSETNYVTFNPGSESRAFRYSPTAEFYTNSLTFLDGKLYSLVKRLDKKFLDIYDADNGKYLESFSIDENASIVQSDGKSIFVLNKKLPRYNIQIITKNE